MEKMQLRQEELDIVKQWVATGDVEVHKEVITENRTIVVPVTREELVIKNGDEVIRIPICEERVEVVKHPTVLEDVSIYRQQYEAMHHVEETLRKEELHMETRGNAQVKQEI
jgi:uncharacterized protein (TIGR02271 family)